MIRTAIGPLAAACVIAASAPLAAAAKPRIDPYKANLAYAECMRAHGVPHPDPDRNGDFHLTPAQEAKLRAVGRARVEAADKACFRYIKPVVSTKPLSARAIAQAVKVLEQVRSCLRGQGVVVGKPFVRNMSRGRAMFGFSASGGLPRLTPKLAAAQHACERRVRLAEKLDAIIAVDRAPV